MPRTGDLPPGVTDADIEPGDDDIYCSVCGDCIECDERHEPEFDIVNPHGEVQYQCSEKCWEKAKREQEDDDE